MKMDSSVYVSFITLLNDSEEAIFLGKRLLNRATVLNRKGGQTGLVLYTDVHADIN